VAPKAAFRGYFSTGDLRERCRAGDDAVVCRSTVSGQQVRLGRSGAAYVGVTRSHLPTPRPLGAGRSITTAGGITCSDSWRGIDCRRGGHGFVIGDHAVVVMRGPDATRFPAEAAPKTPSSTAPVATAPETVTEPPAPAPPPQPVVSCDDFTYQEVAQQYLEANPDAAPTLDRDSNGLACESLPRVLPDPSTDAAPGTELNPTDPSDGIRRTCADFIFQEDAQTYLEADPSDPSHLDRDGDGLACEVLPHDPTRATAEGTAPAAASTPPTSAPAAVPDPLAPDPSTYGQISPVTGLPRTHPVQGYVRGDGTVVHGYYRSCSRCSGP
jgi:hypothetical protein